MVKVAREYSSNPNLMQVPGYVKAWKKEFLWEERTHEFDRMVSRKRTEALVEAQVEEAAKKGRSIAELEFYLFESMASAHRILRELEKKEGFLEDFRPQDYNSLVGRLTEGFATANRVRAEKEPSSLDAVENVSYEEAVKAIKEAAQIWGNDAEEEEG